MEDEERPNDSVAADEPHERQPSVTYKFSTLEEVQSCIEKYELETNSRFIQDRKDRAFGGHSFDLTNRNVRWQTRADSTYSVEVLFDGVPYFVVAEKRLRCEHSGKYKKRGVAKAKGESPLVPQRGTKKTDCMAAIHVLQVLKFPSYHIPENTERRRRAASEQLRKDMFERGGQVVSEMWFYVSLPSADEHCGHDTSEYNTLSFRIDSRIIRRVHELVADGVHDVDEVKRRVDTFVRNELVPIDVASQLEASDLQAALICNRRYNPARSAIMHHIRYAKKQLQLGVNVASLSTAYSDDQDASSSATPPRPTRPRRAKSTRNGAADASGAPLDVYDLDADDVAHDSSKRVNSDSPTLFADDSGKSKSRTGTHKRSAALPASSTSRAKRALTTAASGLELDDVFSAVLREREADTAGSNSKKSKKTKSLARNVPTTKRTRAASSRQRTSRRRLVNGSPAQPSASESDAQVGSDNDTDTDLKPLRVVANAAARTAPATHSAFTSNQEAAAEVASEDPLEIESHDAQLDDDTASEDGSTSDVNSEAKKQRTVAASDRPAL